jgi:hypothetical protein
MSKPAPVFRPIGAPLDVPDEALNALSDKLGVPSLVKPEATPAANFGAKTSISGPEKVSESPARSVEAAELAVGIQSEAPSPQEKLTIELPAYLTHALRRDCAEKRVTQRYLVLQGLQAIGYAVNPSDLVPDNRRPQGKAGRS